MCAECLYGDWPYCISVYCDVSVPRGQLLPAKQGNFIDKCDITVFGGFIESKADCIAIFKIKISILYMKANSTIVF